MALPRLTCRAVMAAERSVARGHCFLRSAETTRRRCDGSRPCRSVSRSSGHQVGDRHDTAEVPHGKAAHGRSTLNPGWLEAFSLRPHGRDIGVVPHGTEVIAM